MDEPDDAFCLPNEVQVIAAEDSDDEDNDQGGGEVTSELREELLRVAWTAAEEAQAEGVI